MGFVSTHRFCASALAFQCDSLEQIALDVFRHHVTAETERALDLESSGAEWWVQIRPSPEKTGRYSMFDQTHDAARNEDDEGQADLARDGISFHWDKDEDLRRLCGGSTYVHPHVSTVTYLTGLGPPTFVVNYRVNSLTGDWISPVEKRADVEGFVSWPATGKHLSFDGRFHHAAPPALMENGKFARQCMLSCDRKDPALQKRLVRRHRRVTFLVNVWLNYHPFEVKPFPETMVDKMSGRDFGTRAQLHFLENHTQPQPLEISIFDGKIDVVDSLSSASLPCQAQQHEQQSSAPHRFIWPMGDCGSGESIHVSIPISEVRSVAGVGGNVRIKWKTSTDVQLVIDQETTTTETTPAKRRRIE